MYHLSELLSTIRCKLPNPKFVSLGGNKKYTDVDASLTHLFNRVNSIESVLGSDQALKELIISPIKENKKEELLQAINDNSLIEYDIPMPQKKEYSFTFADIFCNVGGATIALMEEGGRCIFSVERNGNFPYKKGYLMNYGILPYYLSEWTKGEYPKVDILIASVDFRQLSLQSNKKSKAEDFYGTDWYLLLDLINKINPKAVIIESCKTQYDELLSKSTSTACRTLKEKTGYYVVNPAYLDVRDYGLPQKRKRLWFVAFDNPISSLNFTWPKPQKRTSKLKDILDQNPAPKNYLSQDHFDFIQKSNKKNKELDLMYIYNPLDIEKESKSILMGGQGWVRNIIVDMENKPDILPNGKLCNSEGVRRLTNNEIYRLQGFPENFKRADAWRSSWSYMARATNVNIARFIAHEVKKAIDTEQINKTAKTLINIGLNFNQ